ncbi:threonine/serine exporter family protein [Psychrobacter sp. HD31]|uniref:threonine/serine ThrE exporter family protein n=1 Tax=Psychrobacter sp. HD31 TaxID=3112003 RepID=UPI003DA2A833
MTKSIQKSLPFMPYEEQQQITRLCVRCGLLLMQYGAESAVVVDLTKRLGIALGVASVECAVSFNALTLTTLYNGRCITTTRDTVNQGINVNILVQIQQIVSTVESAHRSADTQDDLIADTQTNFDLMDRDVYPPWAVAMAVGGSCAGFAYLNGGNFSITAVTFVAGFIAMLMRIHFSKRYLNVFVSVILTAFIASLIGATTYFFEASSYAEIAVASSVLLLIPSFPMINAMSDILKGYVNMGVARSIFTFMLVLSACVGIVFALLLLQIQNWGL